MPSERLQVILELITGNYKREAREAATATGQIGKSAQAATGPLGAMNKVWKNFAGPAAILGAGVAVADFARDSIAAASDLEESINAVNVVFGEAAEGIHALGEESVESFGLSRAALNEFAVRFSAFGENIAQGTGRDVAAVVEEMTTRIADFGSVHNVTMEEAAAIAQSTLAGETEAFRRFGGDVSAAAVELKGLEMGLGNSSAELTEQEKILIRYQLFMEQTANTAGDFANTADSTANTIKRLNARFEETKARVGQALMPAMTALLEVVEDLSPAFEDFALNVANLASELGPLVEGLGNLTSGWFDLRQEIRESADSTDVFHRIFGGIADIFTRSGLETITELFRAFEPEVRASGSASRELGEIVVFTGDAFQSHLKPALEDVEQPLSNIERAQARAAAATTAHRDALIQLTSRLLAQLSPASAAYQALTDLKDAQIAAKDAAKEHGRNSEEAAAAQLELATATAAAQAALNNFGDTEGAIRALSNTLGITADEAARILENLGLISGQDWSTTLVIGVRTEGDLRALEGGAIPEGQGIPNPTRIGGAGYGTGKFAYGGWMSQGQMGIVGERGPELFVAGSSGSIVPNDILKSLSRANGPTIVVNSPSNNLAQDLQYAALLASVQTMVES